MERIVGSPASSDLASPRHLKNVQTRWAFVANAASRPWHWLTLPFWPASAQAHSNPLGDGWVAASILPLLLLHPRRAWAFAGALLALVAALAWPLGRLAEASLAAHMAQHLLLIAVAAPLLALSRPVVPFLKGRGKLARPVLAMARPATAFVLHGSVIWLGHLPAVVEWSLDAPWVHALHHFAFFASASLFWWSLLAPGRAAAGASALWTLGTFIHTGMLGTLLTFAPRPLYRGFGYEDQQLAGLLMWVPGGASYFVAGLTFAALWLAQGKRPMERS